MVGETQLSMAAVLKAWDKCDISTAQLAYLQHRLAITIEVLEIIEGEGSITKTYRAFLRRVEAMQADRKEEKKP